MNNKTAWAYTQAALYFFDFHTPKPPLCKGQIPPSAGEMSAQRTKGARARRKP